jgi:hypothetical protein
MLRTNLQQGENTDTCNYFSIFSIGELDDWGFEGTIFCDTPPSGTGVSYAAAQLYSFYSPNSDPIGVTVRLLYHIYYANQDPGPIIFDSDYIRVSLNCISHGSVFIFSNAIPQPHPQICLGYGGMIGGGIATVEFL